MPIDHITFRDTFTLALEFNMKEPPPSDWLTLAKVRHSDHLPSLKRRRRANWLEAALSNWICASVKVLRMAKWSTGTNARCLRQHRGLNIKERITCFLWIKVVSDDGAVERERTHWQTWENLRFISFTSRLRSYLVDEITLWTSSFDFLSISYLSFSEETWCDAIIIDF
jgi:hypothetical protein